jgi:DNA replication protein DnaC
MREDRSIERRIRNARFPVVKSLDDFQWSWPKKINRPQIQNLFRLAFIATHTNVVLIGNVGLGKTHLTNRRVSVAFRRGCARWRWCRARPVRPHGWC